MESSSDIVTNTVQSLPDNFPSVAIAMDLGQVMGGSKKEIDVDLYALNAIATDLGIPLEEFENIHFNIESPYKYGRRGEAWYESFEEGGTHRYFVNIYPSLDQQYGFRQKRMQQTVVHEMQHISDFIDRDYVNEHEKLKRKNRVEKLRRRIGLTASVTTAALTFTPVLKETFETVRDNPELHNWAGLALLIGQPSLWFLGAYPVPKRVLYKTNSLERNAFKAAENHANYENVISINSFQGR